MITMRAVEKRDKSSSITVGVAFMSAFAILPGPIVYGAIFDSACTVWDERCGESLNCLVYDTDRLRRSLTYTSAALLFLGCLADSGVWYFCKNLKIYGEDDESSRSETYQSGKHTEITHVSQAS